MKITSSPLPFFETWGESKRERRKKNHLLLSITLFLSLCRSKASEIGVPKMYIVEMTEQQYREKAWSIRHVRLQKGEGGKAEKGLGVDLMPQTGGIWSFQLWCAKSVCLQYLREYLQNMATTGCQCNPRQLRLHDVEFILLRERENNQWFAWM